MDLKKLKQIVKLFNSAGLTELKLEGVDGDFSGLVLKREKAEATVTQVVTSAPVAAAPAPADEATTAAAAPPAESKPATNEELVYVTAPMVGTFYTAPSPDSPIYAKVGDSIGDDTVVCIVEAMKVMNEIEAEVSGTIVEILVKNAEPVEFGQKLFAVRP